ncbi:MAG: hypothetical protein KAU17_13665 [Spirochaetales bacterium]|nr:hypothetical protein [Spirochaetales bacterium]
MTDIRYYLTVFPAEALIASQLDPDQFGAHMAIGAKKGSSERLIFLDVEEKALEGSFDLDHAHRECVPHANGDPKHSVYLSVYRTLEHIPISALGNLYLTTKDGRSLMLSKKAYKAPDSSRGYYVYKELCPIPPVVVSSLAPKDFAVYMTDPSVKISVPKILFAELKVIDFNNRHTGHIGSLYDKRISHLLSCIATVTAKEGAKKNKTFDRSHLESFSFQTISSGLYIGDGNELATYPMPGIDEIERDHYDWGKSAMIL